MRLIVAPGPIHSTVDFRREPLQTPLWRRLQSAGRLVADEERQSNVDFLLPYDTVLSMWKRRYGGYYHLARVKEWSVGTDDEAEAGVQE